MTSTRHYLRASFQYAYICLEGLVPFCNPPKAAQSNPEFWQIRVSNARHTWIDFLNAALHLMLYLNAA